MRWVLSQPCYLFCGFNLAFQHLRASALWLFSLYFHILLILVFFSMVFYRFTIMFADVYFFFILSICWLLFLSIHVNSVKHLATRIAQMMDFLFYPSWALFSQFLSSCLSAAFWLISSALSFISLFFSIIWSTV